MSPIVERLYALMKKRGVNAKQVTETLRLSSSAFTDWKKGKAKPGVEALSRLAPYFGVSLDYLITGEESDAPSRASVRERMFRSKMERLPFAYQEKVSSYMDGMLDVLEENGELSDQGGA